MAAEGDIDVLAELTLGPRHLQALRGLGRLRVVLQGAHTGEGESQVYSLTHRQFGDGIMSAIGKLDIRHC